MERSDHLLLRDHLLFSRRIRCTSLYAERDIPAARRLLNRRWMDGCDGRRSVHTLDDGLFHAMFELLEYVHQAFGC